MTTSTAPAPMPRSPFLRPSNPRLSTIREHPTLVVSGGATEEIPVKDLERKSSLWGAYANLCNVTIGAGIVGLPYAIKETGFASGTLMIVAVATLTDYSLRQLIELGKIADVNSYETLMEAAFGRPGFVFISVSMFFLSYGTMVAYLIIIKDVLPVLFHIAPHEVGLQRLIMFASSLAVIVPLSMQRDMADLEKTSRLNVFLDVCLVALVAVFSPTSDAPGGVLQTMLDEPLLDVKTFFVGFGVCSFAFVCQDSSFIIAGSLVKPSKQRWKRVTRGAMLTCCTLELIIGIIGYLAYGANTLGNVLNNMNARHWSGIATRAMLSTTMFLAYPLNLYIARHALVALVFQGAPAHEGIDAVTLRRFDRRAILTWALYAASVVPALLLESTGKVLAVTGAIAGSSIAYVGPGLAFLAIHGDRFLSLIQNRWHASSKYLCGYPERPAGKGVHNTAKEPQHRNLIAEEGEQHLGNQKASASVLDVLSWYFFGMPIWSTIATCGQSHGEHYETEATLPKRIDSNPDLHRERARARAHAGYVPSEGNAEHARLLLPRLGSTYGANASSGEAKTDLAHDVPQWVDFCIAVAYIILGVMAMTFGMISICLT